MAERTFTFELKTAQTEDKILLIGTALDVE
jgi:hypothetical protein